MAASDDSFFSPLENTKPYLKIAFEGFAGSGKTFTMANIAVGLYARIGSTKPIVIFDTEEAAKFLRPFFRGHGIPVLHKRSRSLADLSETMKRCRDGASDVLMIDSITHVWENFLASYQKEKNRTRLQFEDWGYIKPTWKTRFSEPFVRDPYHTLMTGRAGYEYEDEKDENGKRQIYKSGIKMKVEGETAYEPDLLVLMERCEDMMTKPKRVWREAMIIKDRSTLIDGKTFNNPGFDEFRPAVEAILEDPSTRPAGPEANAAGLVHTEEDKREWFKRRDVALEEIEALLTKAFPGQSGEAKATKVKALEHGFGSASWTKIKGLTPDVLEDGLKTLRLFVETRQLEASAAS